MKANSSNYIRPPNTNREVSSSYREVFRAINLDQIREPPKGYWNEAIVLPHGVNSSERTTLDGFAQILRDKAEKHGWDAEVGLGLYHYYPDDRDHKIIVRRWYAEEPAEHYPSVKSRKAR